jgi:murein DD-endopeptidase MepM/ murein hydrolase activator NlpD
MFFIIFFCLSLNISPNALNDLSVLEKKVSLHRKTIKNLKNNVLEQKKALMALEYRLFNKQDKVYKNSFNIKDKLKFIFPFIIKNNLEKLVSFESLEEKTYMDAIVYKFIKNKLLENRLLFEELKNTKSLKKTLSKEQKFLSKKVLELEKKEEKLKKLLREKEKKLSSIKNSNVLKTKFIKREKEAKNYIKKQTKASGDKSSFNINDFLRPVNSSKIVGNFGKYWDNITRNWSYRNGVLVDTKYGEEVFASNDGVVSFVAWVDGFGNVVIIKHGNGVFSIYGHLLDASCEIGQKVKKKQLIGHSGDSGSILESMLYFEIKHFKKNIDPSVLF